MKRIGLKLWIGMMLLVVAILLLLWLFQIVFLGTFYKSVRLTELTKEGNKIAEELQQYDLSTLTELDSRLMEQAESFANKQQLTIEILNVSGDFLYSSDYSGGMKMGRGMMMNAGEEVYRRTLSGEKVRLEVKHPRFENTYVLIGIPVIKNRIVTGGVVLSVPLAPVKDTANILKRQLVWITMILLIVSLAISLLLTRQFTKPILEINRTAQAYSKGEFDARAVVRSQDELGQLSVQMNRMGEELKRNEQLRKDLIANVSHELRTPLSLIKGYAETLRDVTGGNAEKREKQLGVIIDETERLTKIVGDILLLSQFQAGAVPLDVRPFSLQLLLEDTIKRYEYGDIRREFRIEGLRGQELTVLADRERISQVLYNLLNNAVRYSEDGSSIIVKILTLPQKVRVEVIDHGVGIREEELPYVYDRYYRSLKAERSKENGSGLGLAIVKSILEMHHTSYGVLSKEGEGSVFWFELAMGDAHKAF